MKLAAEKRKDLASATITQTLGLILACSALCALTSYAADPSWWTAPGSNSSPSAVLSPQVVTNAGVITTNFAPNPNAAVTQGQLKQFTARAVDELNGHLPGGAGPALTNLVYGWHQDYATHGYGPSNIKPTDYTAMNVGQLKTIAGLIYGRLSAVGYTELTPSWLHQNTTSDNTIANLGQLKQVFDFDLSLSGPGTLTATNAGSGVINLNWSLPATNYATSWYVERQKSDGTWAMITNITNPTANSYSVTGLTNGVGYTFQVIASGTNNVSIPSAVTGTPTQGSTAPISSPGPGRYISNQTITVTSVLAGAKIYYTTNGTDPTTSNSWINNGGQLNVTSTTLYKFIAVSGSTTSPETTALYGIGATSCLQAGDSFSMVRKPDGTVWTWGDDGRGQQGDNQANNPAAVPQAVPNLSGVSAVAAVGDHAIALKSNGTVFTWGADDQSQCGNGGTSDLFVPTQITSLSNIAAVYAGQFQGFAVDTSGHLYAWGTNGQGELGDGTTNNHSTPEAITSMTGVVKVSASPSHTMVLKSDGTLWVAGSNQNGELGDGTQNNSLTFEKVPSLSNVVDIAAAGFSGGGGHSMALLADGTVWTWGFSGGQGALGTGSTDQVFTPQEVSLPPAVAVAAVDTKSYVVLADGTVRCFGGNFEGEMGIGNNQDQPTPVEPTGITNVSLLAAGGDHAIVCTTTGAFYGWGNNTSFKLTQDFNNFNRNSEVHDDSFLGFTKVASAETTTLGLKNDGTVWAVGDGSNGAMGQAGNNWGSTERPTQITSLSAVTQIAGGQFDAFAIDNTGTLRAWGANWDGQLGVGSYNNENVPTQVQNVENVTAVAGGSAHMLAVQSDGTVWASGDDSDGELGDGTNTLEDAPVQVVVLSGITAQAVAAGDNTSFVLDSNGTVWAWGKNDTGQLGLGTTGDVSSPTDITGLPTMVAISARSDNAMGIDSNGNVWSWGSMGNSDGTPLMQSGLSNVTAIATGSGHQLAVESDGSLWGWGDSNSGELDNNFSYESQPTQFADVHGAVDVVANDESTFLVKQDGTVSGFGFCLNGQLAANVGIYDYAPKALFGIALNEMPPTVSITSPSAGSSSSFGTAIQFQASATASTGSITKVDYYLEGVKLGTSTTSGSWNFSYTPASYGDYTFEAVTTDSSGVATISVPITVNVLPPPPTITIVSGNNQGGTSGAFLPNALVVSVTNSSGTAVANAAVQFSVTQGVGLVSTSTTTRPATLIQVTTDVNGMAQIYFKEPLVANYTSTIVSMVGNVGGQNSVTFTATTPVDNGPPAAPSGLSAHSINATEIELDWTNNADNATSILLQESTDGINWTTIATLTNTTVSTYDALNLTQGQNYYFQEIAENNNGPAGATEQSSDESDNPADNPNALPTSPQANSLITIYSNTGDNADGWTLRYSGNNAHFVSDGTNIVGVNGAAWYALPILIDGTSDYKIDYDYWGGSEDANSHVLLVDNSTNTGFDADNQSDPTGSSDPVNSEGILNIDSGDDFTDGNQFSYPDSSDILSSADVTPFPAYTWVHGVVSKTDNILTNKVGGQQITTDLSNVTLSTSTRVGFGFYAVSGGGPPEVKFRNIKISIPAPELAVDSDRNGTIVMSSDNPSGYDGNGNSVDTTTSSSPYRFWVNDNEDVPVSDPTFNDTTPETVPPNPSHLDWKSDSIVSARDLEDWTRLWIYIKGINAAIQSGTIKVGLKWKNVNAATGSSGPGIKIVTTSDSDGGLGYIQSISNGTTQANADSNDPINGGAAESGLASRLVIKDFNDSHTNILPTANVADFVFPQWVWHGLSGANPKTFFLFEGTSEGMGELEIVFLKQDGTTLLGSGGSLWLNLMQIKKMYDRGHAAPTEDHFPFPYNVSPTSPGTPYINTGGSLSVSPAMTCQPGDYKVPGADTGLSDNGSPADPQTNPALAAPDEASQLIVFVHGITVTCDNFTSFSQSMYKRLWWSGYKGRFAAFQWTTPSFPFQTITGSINDVFTATALFNNGEYQAWNCGPALAAFVASEKGSVQAHTGSVPAVGIAAHSLGNVVANSAYNGGMHSDYYCALNAAISLSCFFPSQNTTSDPTAILSNDTLYPAFDQDLMNAETPGTPLPLLGGLVHYYGSHTPDVYRGDCTTTLSNVSTKITNYHNSTDYWLQTGYVFDFVPVNWQRDQYFMKPTVFNYGFDPVSGTLPSSFSDIESKLYGWNLSGQASGCGYRDDVYSPTVDFSGFPETSSVISSVHRPVNDPLEQMSYVARSRTLALGAQSDAGWAGLQGGAAQIDLIAQYGFTSAQNDHSGAFNRSIQQLSDTTSFGATIPFYDQLRLDLTGHNQENP